MIEVEKQVFTLVNEKNIPSHWRVRHESTITTRLKTNKIIAIGDGDDRFRSLLLKAIREAKNTIMLSSFILSDDEIIEALIDAFNRQIRCYLLFSTEIQLSKEYREDISEFDQRTLEAHKNMLDRFAGHVLARTNDHLHAKFLLVDSNTPDQKGFISTANFTKEALIRNQEIGLILNNEEILEIFDFFRKGFWSESIQELVRIGHWDSVKKEELNQLFDYSYIRTTSSNDTRLRDEILSVITEAEGPLFVSSYGFDKEHEIVKTLQEKARTNEIVVLTRPRERNHPVLDLFFKAGVKVLSFDYLHAKFVFAPSDGRGIVMTANIEPRGLDRGYEIGLLINGNAVGELQDIVNEWLKTAPLIWENGGNIQTFQVGKVKLPDGRDLFEQDIVDEEPIELKDEKPRDLLQMQQMLDETPNFSEYAKRSYAKKIKLKRRIISPTLPEKAVPVDPKEIIKKELDKKKGKKDEKVKKFSVPVYKFKNKYYGLIKSWKELEKVKNDSNLPKNIQFVAKSS